MAEFIVFAKNKLSNGLKRYLISRAFVQGCSILRDRGTLFHPKLKWVLIKKSVSVKISKNRYRYWYVISIGGKNRYRYRYVIYFTESVSVSVRLKVPKSVRIGIGQNRFEVNRSIPKTQKSVLPSDFELIFSGSGIKFFQSLKLTKYLLGGS